MSNINLAALANFQYPAPGYRYPAVACNATWKDVLGGPLDLSYPVTNTTEYAILYVASLICRSSDNASVASTAWHVYSKLSPFGYRPSLIFAAIALAVFGLSGIWHGWQLYRTRAWVMTPVIIGAALELYGWVDRALAHADPSYYYVEQLAVLTIAPTFFSCTIYTLFQIIVSYLDPQAFFGLNSTKVMWSWISIDVATLVVQAVGGALAATSGGNQTLFDIGSYVMLAGIALQLFVALVFTGIAITYFRKVYRKASGLRDTTKTNDSKSFKIGQPMGRFIVGLFAAQIFIIIRGCYRIAELAGGLFSSIARNQAALLALDAVPMMIVIWTLNAIHPQFVLPPQLWKTAGRKAVVTSSTEGSNDELELKDLL